MCRSFMINTCSLSAITQHIAHAWKKGVSAFVSCLRIDLLCEMWFLQCNKCFAYGRETSSWRISGETFKFTGEKKHARHGSTATSLFLPLNSSMEEWIGDASVATRWAPPQVNKSDGCFTWSPCTGIYHFDFCLFPSCEKRSISTRSTFLLYLVRKFVSRGRVGRWPFWKANITASLSLIVWSRSNLKVIKFMMM